MNIFIMFAIVIANVIAILLIYQFVKRLPKVEKTIFIGVSFAIIYILVSIIYWLSGFGIESIVNEAAKDFILYTFVPVNVIILVPFVATKYNKLRFKEIEKSEFVKRLIIVGIIGAIILTWECFYFKKIKEDIEATGQAAELKGQEVNDIDEIIQRNGVYTNEIGVNITNTEVVNETTNTVIVNKENNVVNKNYLE